MNVSERKVAEKEEKLGSCWLCGKRVCSYISAGNPLLSFKPYAIKVACLVLLGPGVECSRSMVARPTSLLPPNGWSFERPGQLIEWSG